MVELKTYAKSFTIHVGPLSMRGKLTSVQAPVTRGKGGGSYKTCSPNKQPVTQVWRDPDDNIWETSDLQKYIEGEDGEMLIVDQEAVKEAKVSQLPKNLMVAAVHKISDMDELWPSNGKNSYVFEPDAADPRNTMLAEVFTRALSSGKYGIIALINLQNHEGLFRLIVWRGRLVLQPQIYTDKINPHEEHEFRVESKATKKVQNLFEKLESDFAASDYEDGTIDRITAAEVISAGITDGKALGKKMKTATPMKPQEDLLAVLDNALGEI